MSELTERKVHHQSGELLKSALCALFTDKRSSRVDQAKSESMRSDEKVPDAKGCEKQRVAPSEVTLLKVPVN